MAEQSHREEMNAAIRAQRERQGTAKPSEARPEPSSALARLRARLLGKDS